MDANCFRLNKSSALCSTHWNTIKRKPEHPLWLQCSERPQTNITGETRKTNAYKDNLFNRLAIHHLSKSVQEATGLGNNKSGFESLVEAATVAKQKFDPIQQQEVIIQALHKAFPKPILSLGIFCRFHHFVLCLVSRAFRDFDDMSCEMIFGQEPPASIDDTALKQPCYKLCKAYKKHGTDCLTS
ncbi:hypothetical protein JHK82_053776 [Glycine max]|nr:hypothetical protein JHK86_053624 [Glycine max]KAG4928088.1 hypothetical protein JHK85_054574 [Glycine max]KAG5083611.1 hypothetical protein JHK84_053649 [Glycine max]KAG5086379.1 hypothetical protein JHK82_053776 [Glycine max]